MPKSCRSKESKKRKQLKQRRKRKERKEESEKEPKENGHHNVHILEESNNNDGNASEDENREIDMTTHEEPTTATTIVTPSHVTLASRDDDDDNGEVENSNGRQDCQDPAQQESGKPNRKRKNDTKPTEEKKKIQHIENIQRFWSDNYTYDKEENQIYAQHIYTHFQSSNLYHGEPYQDFTKISANIQNLKQGKKRKDINRKKTYYAKKKLTHQQQQTRPDNTGDQTKPNRPNNTDLIDHMPPNERASTPMRPKVDFSISTATVVQQKQTQQQQQQRQQTHELQQQQQRQEQAQAQLQPHHPDKLGKDNTIPNNHQHVPRDGGSGNGCSNNKVHILEESDNNDGNASEDENREIDMTTHEEPTTATTIVTPSHVTLASRDDDDDDNGEVENSNNDFDSDVLQYRSFEPPPAPAPPPAPVQLLGVDTTGVAAYLHNLAVAAKQDAKRMDASEIYIRIHQSPTSPPYGVIELPIESDGKLTLQTIRGYFSEAAGLRFQTHAGAWKYVEVTDEGVMETPPDGWRTKDYFICESVASEDIIFLYVHHTGKHIDVEGDSVSARWNKHGTLQKLVIEKKHGGLISHGDTIFLKAVTGNYIDVEDTAVRARWNERGNKRQKLIIEKKGGGAIMYGDTIFLKAHTEKYIDVDIKDEGNGVNARWIGHGNWKKLIIEKEKDNKKEEVEEERDDDIEIRNRGDDDDVEIRNRGDDGDVEIRNRGDDGDVEIRNRGGDGDVEIRNHADDDDVEIRNRGDGEDKDAEVYICVDALNDTWKKVSREEQKKIQQELEESLAEHLSPVSMSSTMGAPPPFVSQTPWIPRSLCKYFNNGLCRWGETCRFLHPGVNDKMGISKDHPQLWNASPGDGCIYLSNKFVVCLTWPEAEKCIRKYEVETNSKFAIYRKHSLFNKPGKIDISTHKIQFEDIIYTGKEQCIQFTGTPFIVLGAKYLDCIYGTDRNVTTKKKRFEKEDEMRKLVIKVTGDPALAKKRRAVRDTKKIGCPASIVVRDIAFFPQFIASRDTRWFRTETSKVLRDAFVKDSDAVVIERKFYIKFPDVESHVGHYIHENDTIAQSRGVEVGLKRCYSPIDSDFDENENEDEEDTIEDIHVQTVTHTHVEDPEDDVPRNVPRNEPHQDDVFDFMQGTADHELAPNVKPELALGVQNVWTNGVEKEELTECVRRIQTPENCRFVGAPTLHPRVQRQLPEPAKERDEKRLRHQTLLVKAATPLVQTLDILNSLEPGGGGSGGGGGGITAETIEVLKQHVESSFVCLSQLNLGLLRARRDDVVHSRTNRECDVTEDCEHATEDTTQHTEDTTQHTEECVEIQTGNRSVSNDDEGETINGKSCETT